MSIDFDPSMQRWRVRWREEGRQRSGRFKSREEAAAFEQRLAANPRPATPLLPAEPEGGNGIYAYDTKEGVRYRFVFRQSDGTQSNRRGFRSRRSAATARRRLVESIERGEVKVARETFGEFWARLLEERRPYLTAGSMVDYETHGRKRLLPAFAATPLARVDEANVRRWMAAAAADAEAGRISPKTVNNARTCLSVVLNEACRRGLIPRNPCAAVPALPVDRRELDYLRLNEIDLYLDACPGYYRPLAQLLIGSGVRISEALALRFGHLELERGAIRVYAQRDRDGRESRPTKGKRFRSVQIGPALASALAALQSERAAGTSDWMFLCPRPRRGRYAKRDNEVPPSRKTVHEWHEAALVDAGLRDMPLHALRHTAAASWLATGHPLIFVQASSATDPSPRLRSTTGTSRSPSSRRRCCAPRRRLRPHRDRWRDDQPRSSDSRRSCVTSDCAVWRGT